MKVLSPSGLHYPITVGELAKKRDDEVQRSEPLFTYFYETIVEEGDKWGEKKNVKKRFPVKFEASADGTITKWFIKEGTVIQRPGYVPCKMLRFCRNSADNWTDLNSSKSKSHARTRPNSAACVSIAART